MLKTENFIEYAKKEFINNNQGFIEKCLICVKNTRSCVIKSCGHIICCVHCALALKNCAYCKKAYKSDDILKIYIP